MKEVHFYSGKIKSLIMLIVSSIFTVGLYHIGFKNDSLFLMMILYLAFVLFYLELSILYCYCSAQNLY